MKLLTPLLLSLALCVALDFPSFADDGSSAAKAVAAMAPTPAPAASPTMAPVPAGTPTSAGTIGVAEPSAPPQWAQDVIVAAEKLPLVGPFVSKVMLWAGILAGILTTLVGALLAVVNTLMGVMNLAGLANVATALANFRDGKIMYWLKFFSLFNAKKPDGNSTPPTIVS